MLLHLEQLKLLLSKAFAASFLLLFVSGLLSSQTAHGDLVAQWRLNEGAGDVFADSVGGFDGFLPKEGDREDGLEPTIEWVDEGPLPGILDSSVRFLGPEVSFIETPYFGIGGADARTITAWVKGPPQNPNSAIVAYGVNGGGEKWHFRIDSGGGGTRIRTEFSAGQQFGGDSVAIEEDVWHHVASVFPEGGTEGDDVIHYVDGVFEPKLGGTSPMINTGIDPEDGALPVHIGFAAHHAGRYFNGQIADVRIYDEGLDQAAIIDIMLGAGALPPGVEPMTPPIGARDTVGTRVLKGSRSNQVFGEAGPNVPGLGQSWYAVGNPGSKAGVDAIFENNERAVPYFHAESEITWWSGSMDVSDVPAYPTEVEGVITGDNYTVKLEGEIKIDESGPIRFLDGVDDYTYLAIDLDRSGVAGDTDAEVLIDDNTWTDALSMANNGAAIVEVDFEDIAAGGEWLAIEFNMAEGGGGDHGMLYWDAQDEDDFFPLDQGEGVLDIDAAVFMIPDSHLRGPETPPELLSADVSGSAPVSPRGWEFDVDPSAGTADTLVVENPDGDIFTSILDVDGLDIHVNPLGEVSEGDSFQVIVADTITGTVTVATEGWSFDPATGSVVFGAVAPGLAGDINGSGTVDFADFLILSTNFGTMVTANMEGDLDGDGSVAFSDFLILSNNFGTTSPSSVPEPSGLVLLCSAGLLLGFVRRRRR